MKQKPLDSKNKNIIVYKYIYSNLLWFSLLLSLNCQRLIPHKSTDYAHNLLRNIPVKLVFFPKVKFIFPRNQDESNYQIRFIHVSCNDHFHEVLVFSHDYAMSFVVVHYALSFVTSMMSAMCSMTEIVEMNRTVTAFSVFARFFPQRLFST